ncbi:MAG: prepilin-type N-terminal cleavage/methylation domain-containing protein [Desulfobacterales bacterium]|jgi:prepilin-type N-terminal cleavage/methylation domain-containing protein|nr:prepilin-type N-terminal cleavage/methylation domain-containing protein [Desulfobacterales bacterium]
MKAGFTLIELMVVLVIISLVSGLVGPRVISSFANLHVKTATREIAGTLRFNRSKAVGEKLLRVALFDLDGRRVRMFSLTGMTSYAPEDKIMETPADMTYELPEGVSFKEAISGEDTFETGEIPIVFFPNGSSSGGEVVVSGESGMSFGIAVDDITGLVKVAEIERDG